MFRLNVDEPVATVVPDRIATGDPFTNREFGVDYRFQASRTALTIALLDIAERYKLDPASNRDIKVINVLVARQLNQVLTWDIGLDYERQEFKISNSTSQVNAVTSLRWQLGQRLGLRFIYAHSSLNPHRYDENQIGITVSYAVVGSAQANTLGSPPMLLPTSSMSSQFPAQIPPSSPQ